MNTNLNSSYLTSICSVSLEPSFSPWSPKETSKKPNFFPKNSKKIVKKLPKEPLKKFSADKVLFFNQNTGMSPIPVHSLNSVLPDIYLPKTRNTNFFQSKAIQDPQAAIAKRYLSSKDSLNTSRESREIKINLKKLNKPKNFEPFLPKSSSEKILITKFSTPGQPLNKKKSKFERKIFKNEKIEDFFQRFDRRMLDLPCPVKRIGSLGTKLITLRREHFDP